MEQHEERFERVEMTNRYLLRTEGKEKYEV